MKNIFKSIGAVLAGFIAVALLSVATDFVLETFKIFPPTANAGAYTVWMLASALAYRSFYTIVGGYLTASLAPNKPWRHIVVLMALGAIGGVAGAINGWSLGNHWYPVALAVSGPFFVWLGGKLKIINNSKTN